MKNRHFRFFYPVQALLILSAFSAFSAAPLLHNLENKSVCFDSEFDVGNKRFALTVSKDNQYSTFNFSLGEWRSYTPPDFTPTRSSRVSPKGEIGYYTIDPQNNVFSFDPSTYRFVRTEFHWHSEILTMTKVNGDLLALTKQKKILKLVDQKWIEVSLPPGAIINQMATVPLYKEMDLIE